MNIETDITISVYPDSDYHFEVTAGDMFRVEYHEHNISGVTSQVAFGSLDEMEAVANAMLKVVALRR